MNSLESYLVISAILFTFGIFAVITRKNAVAILMGIELILNSANINFIGFSNYLNDLSGQIFSLFILVVAAAEAAIGLAILTIFFKKSNSISVDTISRLKG